jgi:hypothetical protein
LKDALEGIGADSADALLEIYAGWGVPLIKPAYDAFNLANQAMQLTETGSEAPRGGLAVSSTNSNVSSGGQAVLAVSRSTGALTETRIEVPTTATTTSVTAVQRPQASASQFDGSYSGSYSGTYTYTDGSGTLSLSGGVSLSVRGGAISVTSPGSGSGSLSSRGLVLMGSGTADGTRCSFGGSFTLTTQTNRVLAGGSWRCSDEEGSSTGRWSAVR